jgi:hypothetical protein
MIILVILHLSVRSCRLYECYMYFGEEEVPNFFINFYTLLSNFLILSIQCASQYCLREKFSTLSHQNNLFQFKIS